MGTILSSQTLVQAPTLDDDDFMMNAVVLLSAIVQFLSGELQRSIAERNKAKSTDPDTHEKKIPILDKPLFAHERVFVFLFVANRSNHMELMGTDIINKEKKYLDILIHLHLYNITIDEQLAMVATIHVCQFD